jgi:hypothetical protein
MSIELNLVGALMRRFVEVLKNNIKNTFSFCSLYFYFMSVSSVVNFRGAVRVLNNTIKNLCGLCVLCGSIRMSEDGF